MLTYPCFMCSLVQKYNVPGPRYTSYPTVPFWDTDAFSGKQYKAGLKKSFDEQNVKDGISLYTHLPFCESMCTFCGCHKRITRRHEVEGPYIKAVLREWQLYREILGERPVIRELHLGGGTPTFFSPENLRLLIEGIFRGTQQSEDLECSFEGHPNNTTKTHLQVLYDLGFRRVSYGVQDYNERVQKTINRIQPFEKVKEATERAREIGYTSVGHDLIFGLPHQRLEHIEETIARTRELLPDRIAFYSYAHVPWLKGNGQRGYKDTDLPDASAKRNQYERGKEMLTAAGYTEIGMDHFALESDSLYKAMADGTLHRNFMGYTAMRTGLMLGLGVSSISDSGYGFAQNVKQIEEYEHLVENRIIPIYRGHLLNSEDQVIRNHILNLMCRFKTTWTEPDSYFPQIGEVLEQLGELAADGLVEIGENELTVTEAGRPFIRNVCMAFDLRLHRKTPEKRLFSMTV